MANQLSRAGAGFISGHEGIYLSAYPDAGRGWAVPTVGLGHTSAAGPPPVRKGDTWSMARVFTVFSEDVRKIEIAVNKAIKVKLSQPAFDCLADFQHNTGAINSPNIAGRMNRGDIDGALRTLGLYVNANGKRFEGLANRRREEIAMFRDGIYPRRQIAVKDSATSRVRYVASNSIPWREPEPALATLDLDIPLPPIQLPPQPVPNLPTVIATAPPSTKPFWSWLWAILRND